MTMEENLEEVKLEEAPKSFMQKVEDSLREAQKNKKFKDSEIRIGGAKKEMAAIRKLTRIGADGKTVSGIALEDLSESERLYGEVTMIKFVKKDQVFPKFVVQEQLNAGVSSGAAFLKMKLRESFPNEPKVKTEVARRVYIGFANLLYDSFKDQIKVANVKSTQEEIKKNFLKYFTKFILEEGKVYEDATLAILDLISVPNLPYRTEFESFDDAYDYLQGYAKKAYDQELALYRIVEERLKNEFGLTQWEIGKGIKNPSDPESLDEEINDFADRWCSRFENLRDKKHQAYNFIKSLFEHYNKIIYITMRKSVYSGDGPANHLFFVALDKMPQLLDKHKRPLKDSTGIDAYSLAGSLFSTTFANFIAHLGGYYGGAQKDNYDAALKMEAVSPEKSAELIAPVEQATNKEIENAQNRLVEIMAAKTIADFDVLWKENKIQSYGFYMSFQRRGRTVKDHAYYDKLEDNVDKWAWIDKYIKNREKFIAEKIELLRKFKEESQPHPDDWAWAAEYLEGAEGVPKPLETGVGEPILPAKRKPHSNPPLEFIERVGGLRIDKARLDNQGTIREYLNDTFGFKAFELGASLKDEEAREIIYHFLGAIADFGDILNFDFADFNRKMGLSMGFATRGSGSANAHYEALGRLINLTKSRGDGSVAHELGHYLDNVIPALDHIEKYSFAQFASYDKADSRGHQPGNIENPAVKLAMLEIMAFILYGKKKIPTDSPMYNPYSPFDSGKGSWVEYVAKAENSGTRYLRTPMFYQNIEDLPALYAARSSSYMYFENYSRNSLLVYDIAVREAKLKEFTFKIPSKMSMFYTNSARVGGDYWVRPTELFSRAFEVYVSDKLQAANRKNTFLCHGEYSSSVTEYIPNFPYPQFEERKYLMGLFDNLFVQLKSAYNIGDFKPFTTEKNEVTKADLALSSKEQSKARENYEKKLKVLTAILGTRMKTIKLDNGVTVSYLPESTYRWKNNPQTHYTLKSMASDKIVLVDDAGDDVILLPDQFVSRYELEEDTFAAGGKFAEALQSEPDNDFYRHFIKAHDLYSHYVDECSKISEARRKKKDYSMLDEKAFPESKDATEEALTELFRLPNWREGVEKVGNLAAEITSAETFAMVKEEILLNLGEQILSLFDHMAENGDAAMRQIYFLQLAIDVVSVIPKQKEAFGKYFELVGYAEAVITERGEKFNSNKKKNAEEIKKLADEVEGVISNVYHNLEINFDVEEFEKIGEEFEAHKVFGFDKVILDDLGRESYHPTQVESFKFGKKSSIEMEICQSPNGLYFIGMNTWHGTGGGGRGCWMSEKGACKTLQDAYNKFFIEAFIASSGWGSEGRTIIKQIETKLNITESTIAKAKQKLDDFTAKEKAQKDAEKAAEDAALADFSKYMQVGDRVFAYEYMPYGPPREDGSNGPVVEFTVTEIDGTFEIDDYVREERPELNLPEYGISIKARRPYNAEEIAEQKSGEEDGSFHQNWVDPEGQEQDLDFVVSNGKVHQAITAYGSINNAEEPIIKEPAKIIKNEN